MKRSSVMVAAVAAMVWATGARAQDQGTNTGDTRAGTVVTPPSATVAPDGTTTVAPGTVQTPPSSATVGPDGTTVAPGTGGSGNVSTQGYGYQQSYPLPSDTPPMNATAPSREEQKDTESWLRGASILVGGGVEGYTGSLAPRVNVGPAWNVIFGIHPSSVFGIEFTYSGAINSIKYANYGLTGGNGVDIFRNGGQANVTFGIGPWEVQPFVLAGVGANYYSVSDAARSAGFSSGWAGYIPVGGGLRGQIHHVTIDIRASWDLPFSDHLYPGGTGQDTLGLATGNYGRWNATLNVGGTF